MTLLAVMVALSAAPTTIACPEFGVVGVAPDLGRFAAEHLATELDHRGVRVVTAKQIQSLLGQERQRAMLGCDANASSCTAELVDALGAGALLLGELAKVGATVRLNLRLVSRAGTALESFSLKAASEEALLDQISDQSGALAERVRKALPSAGKAEVEPPAVSRASGGGGGVPTSAWIAGGSGVALLAVAGGLYLGAADAHGKLTDSTLAPGSIDATQRAGLVASGEALQWGARLAAGLGAAGVVAGVVLAVTGRSGPVAVLPSASGLQVVGVWP